MNVGSTSTTRLREQLHVTKVAHFVAEYMGVGGISPYSRLYGEATRERVAFFGFAVDEMVVKFPVLVG